MGYRDLALEWRENQSEEIRTSGVVLIWKGEVYGWKNVLRDASSERPGAVAVDTNEHVYIAEGGDDYNGAKLWVAMEPRTQTTGTKL